MQSIHKGFRGSSSKQKVEEKEHEGGPGSKHTDDTVRPPNPVRGLLGLIFLDFRIHPSHRTMIW